LTGILSDRFGRIEVASFITFLTGILCFALWIPAQSFGLLTFYSIVSGLIQGIFHSSHEYLYPQIFSGISYLVACLCMVELARVLRKRRKPTDVTLQLSESTLMNRNDV
jgi:MFS family permease